MFARALIVLLVVLNLGVAAWWMARDAATPPVTGSASPDGVARLQLLRELSPEPKRAAPPSATTGSSVANHVAETPAAVKPAADAAAAATPAAPERCHAFGPFANAAAANAARVRLQSQVSRLHLRQVASSSSASGWRVWLPPLADRAAAQAMAARFSAAGFSDLFIVASGEEANSIALGRYGSEPSARRHEAALHAAGFAGVRAEALGKPGAASTWIDVAVPAASTIASQRTALGAARVESIDCKSVP